MNDASAPALDEEAATPEETRQELLGGQARRGAGIRSSFLQERGGARAPGPLHLFVQDRRLFALQLYLLLHCIARAEPWDASLPAGVWARALDKTGKGAEATVSRSWHWLREHNLVATERDQRLVRAYKLQEDGAGATYTRSRDYFILPLAFFREAWHTKLGLPATAVLLIALDRSRKRVWFELRKEQAAGWFGISADTLQRGLDQLRDEGLLEVRQRRVKDPRARYGWTSVNEYRFLGSFAVHRVDAPDGNTDEDDRSAR